FFRAGTMWSWFISPIALHIFVAIEYSTLNCDKHNREFVALRLYVMRDRRAPRAEPVTAWSFRSCTSHRLAHPGYRRFEILAAVKGRREHTGAALPEEAGELRNAVGADEAAGRSGATL